jgi:hypothetical protein
VSSGALVNRMNFAVDLTSGRLRSVHLAAPTPAHAPLAIGSPEFQRR